MTLPKELTTVTPLSKTIAAILFIFIPFITFFIGMRYQRSITPPLTNNVAPKKPEGIACTLEAKICPDGSSVGRIPPNCEFAPCPVESSKANVQKIVFEAPFKLSFSLPKGYAWRPYEYGKAPLIARTQYGGGSLQRTDCDTSQGVCPTIPIYWEWDQAITSIDSPEEKEQLRRKRLAYFSANQCFDVLPEEFSEIMIEDKKVLIFNGTPSNSCPSFKGKIFEIMGFIEYIEKEGKWYSIAVYDYLSTPTEEFSTIIKTLHY